jgi:tRNA uridine 5-carboxymethylaminomethyl modification enzyme
MDYDAIVIGGGHAGLEAALALARLSFKTLMITQNIDCICKLSCNPAVGGLAKGNLVREIDALGGEMAKLIDATMIQFRMLNRSKGPAVQSPRAQADSTAYSRLAGWTLERQAGLTLFQDTVVDLMVDNNGEKIEGVITERGHKISAKTVVLTTGTFMEAVIFIGEYTASSGRIGEPAAKGLGKSLRKLKFNVGRLKTGTPARVLRSSLDFSRMTEQKGDEVSLPFSFSSSTITRPNISCYITHTTEKTHKIIRDNIHTSPLFGGKIKGVGPRYCPSIEDKVMRFPDRNRHQIFVEPEGLKTELMYLNGISSSLPEEVQTRFLKTVPGLENLAIMKPGYAVEYDYLNPTQLYPDLQTKRIKGLFIAGQTNGTSGYEEAGCQGLMAGINAARYLKGKKPFILTRAEAYTGVLIDDLVTMGTKEPYRLFTSHAEYRLALRHDTADIRLMQKGYEMGLQSDAMMEKLNKKKRELEEIQQILTSHRVQEEDLKKIRALERHLGKSLEQVLKMPEYHIQHLIELCPEFSQKENEYLYQCELDTKYSGYIKRQEEQVKRFHKMESVKIQENFNYDGVIGLSNEARQKLKAIKPISLGQASRISGIRQSDISILMLYLKKKNRD